MNKKLKKAELYLKESHRFFDFIYEFVGKMMKKFIIYLCSVINSPYGLRLFEVKTTLKEQKVIQKRS